MTRLAVACLAVLAVATNSAAQKDLGRERVTVQFSAVAVADVFPAMARSLGYDISMDSNLRALVTFHAENVKAQTALTAICESVGCQWRLEGNRLIVEAIKEEITILRNRAEQVRLSGTVGMSLPSVRGLDDELPFDITWSPMDLHAALFTLARMYETEVDLAPALKGRRVALSIKSATLRQALDAVCVVAGCRWELVNTPRRTLRVVEGHGAPAAGAGAPLVPAASTRPGGQFGVWKLAPRADGFQLSASMDRIPKSHAAYVRGGYPAGSEGINTGSLAQLTCARDSKGKIRGTVYAGFVLAVADFEAMQMAPIRVTLDGRARTEAWTRYHEILTLPSGFPDKLAASKAAQIEVQPGCKNCAGWITLVFPLEGFADAWAQMRLACQALQ